MVDPNDNTLALKDTIEELKNIPAEKQELKFNNGILGDNTTLKDSGVHEGDTII